MIRLNNYSTQELKRVAKLAEDEYTLLCLTAEEVVSLDTHRLEQIARDCDALAVYGNYVKDGEVCKLTDMQRGSVRDDFDFGPVMLVNTVALQQVAAEMPELNNAAFYALCLRFYANIEFCPEIVSVMKTTKKEIAGGEEQFRYVDPRNRESQIEKENVFTQFLQAIGADVEPGLPVSHDGEFPVEASVIIPVKNRAKTIGDAIRSALSQNTDFPFNVIVVDNHSDDGTSELIESIDDMRLVHLIPEPGHGIGGCWNAALDSECCGRFAVQLDSDDVYSSENTLQLIVDKFRETQAACVIGSYTLTDFDLNVIPPGLIDHKEWTDDNGANNALRINGLGAPRAFFTPIARKLRFPDVSYGEDYAMVLRLTRKYRLARIFDSLYFCRRWGGNSDSNLSRDKINANNTYKDWIRSVEIVARRNAKH
ncbi:MAG: glycosyltransferase [Bacteroides sp.]|nr:glycosyltransferase [Bacteroides sp.]MCM1379940.1 glycosyltransferase [Bacteroides sp.]MCM1446205.1 glycosyltransferase [Prevotella sp.]